MIPCLSLAARVIGLRCPACKTEHPLAKGTYVCRACGGNLDVAYDYDAIRRVLTRDALARLPEQNMWRYAPLYPVESCLSELHIGGTPLVNAPRLATALGVRTLHIKDDGRNPSASFKDRASAIALLRAREVGESFVTGASTGNAASSTAVLAAALGMRCRIFIPKAAPVAKVAQLLAFGAEVIAVDGTYDQAFDLSLAATARFGWYNRNTGFNPFSREGKKSVSFEISEQLDFAPPDLVAVPVGDGNIISGVFKGFAELKLLGLIERVPRLLAAQAAGSDAVVTAVESGGDGIEPVSGETVADSISVSVPRDGAAAVRAVRASGGFGVRVSDDAILRAILTVARGSGVFCEPAAAAAYAALEEAARQGRLDPHWRVVMLATGSGLKDVASVVRVAGSPTLLPTDASALDRFAGVE